MFEYLTFGICILIILCQRYRILKSIYKISYYETKLENRGVNIDDVKNMSLWAMFTRG